MTADQDSEQRAALGRRLKSAREKAGLTQDQIADKFSINKATVSAWETGRGLPDALRLARLAAIYKTTTGALIGEARPSDEAMQFAAQYEGMPEAQRAAFKVMWSALVGQVQLGGERTETDQRKTGS